MQVVEFLGVPGSGKSTLASALVDDIPKAVLLEEAVRSAIANRGEDAVARAVARISRSADGKVWSAAYARATDRFAALARFIHSHPKTLNAVTAIQQERADRDLDPALTLGWILNLMARYQIATESDAAGVLVVDEGFAQRGVALIAGGFDEEDLDRAAGYVQATPRADLLVVVEAPLETCAQRLDERGWSERLAHSSADERLRFLQSAATLVRRIASEVETAGAATIWVDGTTSHPDSVSRIGATLQPDR